GSATWFSLGQSHHGNVAFDTDDHRGPRSDLECMPAARICRAMTSDTTALAREIRRIIATDGPISVEQFMSLCLGHPSLGYYLTRDPFGVAGDFTTAPEVSQMFGELIGLWAAAIWQEMGKPEAISIVELGPGRGTLMADALRAGKIVPEFFSAIT